MKSLIDYIECIAKAQEEQAKIQKNQSQNIKDMELQQSSITKKLEDLELQQSQVIVNQEYANCLLELNS